MHAIPLSWEGEGWNTRCYKAAGILWGLQSAATSWAEKSLPHPWAVWNVPFPGNTFCSSTSCSGAKCCCCHWTAPSSRPSNMASTLWSRTILKACPTSKHFILTSRISSGWTGESWKYDLGLCQLKFCHCRGLAEAALVPVVPPCQPLPLRHCWNCRLALKTGRAENCLWPQGCCSWKYFKYFL